MSLGPSQSILRVKDGYIYGWSGQKALTSSAVNLLDYTNPPSFYLTRLMIGIDWSSMGAGEVLSYTVNVDGQGLYVEKFTITDMNLGNQPSLFEFVIPPNSSVKIQGTQSDNNGAISCILTGYRV
jgi:hypothetical protein